MHAKSNMFHAEMMGDIMFYDQALQQPDGKQFANAVVKEDMDMFTTSIGH
jgi:hypothetical protein